MVLAYIFFFFNHTFVKYVMVSQNICIYIYIYIYDKAKRDFLGPIGCNQIL